MTAEAWIALIIGGAALLVNLGVIAVGYGVKKGTITALAARVTAIESEMSALTVLTSDVARIDERTKSMSSNIDAIMNSWLLHDPPPYGPPPPQHRRGA